MGNVRGEHHEIGEMIVKQRAIGGRLVSELGFGAMYTSRWETDHLKRKPWEPCGR